MPWTPRYCLSSLLSQAKQFSNSIPRFPQVSRDLHRAVPAPNPNHQGLTIAVYVGMLVGALFWGLSADVIGRKFAFNVSLMISSVFCIIAGASPNWIVLGLFTCLAAFGSGGNLVLDTAVFLEYIPSKEQWLVTLMAAWWGLGQLVAGLFAWAFLPNFSCATVATCTYDNNKGWRYVWFANGALVFVMSLLRITVIKLRETPKFLIGAGRDAEAVETLQFIATKYNRTCSLTLEQLEACGSTGGNGTEHAPNRFSFSEVNVHIKGLFATKRLGLSTSLIWFSWLLIGKDESPEVCQSCDFEPKTKNLSQVSLIHCITCSSPTTSPPAAHHSECNLNPRHGATTLWQTSAPYRVRSWLATCVKVGGSGEGGVQW